MRTATTAITTSTGPTVKTLGTTVTAASAATITPSQATMTLRLRGVARHRTPVSAGVARQDTATTPKVPPTRLDSVIPLPKARSRMLRMAALTRPVRALMRPPIPPRTRRTILRRAARRRASSRLLVPLSLLPNPSAGKIPKPLTVPLALPTARTTQTATLARHRTPAPSITLGPITTLALITLRTP